MGGRRGKHERKRHWAECSLKSLSTQNFDSVKSASCNIQRSAEQTGKNSCPTAVCSLCETHYRKSFTWLAHLTDARTGGYHSPLYK